jgi:hypothetical protein
VLYSSKTVLCMRSRHCAVLVWALLQLAAGVGCAARAPSSTPASMPHDAGLRRTSLHALGQLLFEGLRSGSLGQSFASTRELDGIVLPDARLRLERERASWQQGAFAPDSFRDWEAASFVGFCAQGAREEAPRASLGLTQTGWVMARILVVARGGPTAVASASWVEGDFVYTDQGWRVLSLRRVESPRRHHADLELAPCDVEAGLH